MSGAMSAHCNVTSVRKMLPIHVDKPLNHDATPLGTMPLAHVALICFTPS